jgi:hypothetical protein
MTEAVAPPVKPGAIELAEREIYRKVLYKLLWTLSLGERAEAQALF